jgi:hypothetical protein
VNRRIKRHIERSFRHLIEYELGDRLVTVDLADTPTTFKKQRRRVQNVLYRHDRDAIVTGWFEVTGAGVIHLHAIYRGLLSNEQLTALFRRVAIKPVEGVEGNDKKKSAVWTSAWDGSTQWIKYRFFKRGKPKPFMARAAFDYGRRTRDDERWNGMDEYECSTVLVDEYVPDEPCEWVEPESDYDDSISCYDSPLEPQEYWEPATDEESHYDTSDMKPPKADRGMLAELIAAGWLTKQAIKSRSDWWTWERIDGRWKGKLAPRTGKVLPKADLRVACGRYAINLWRKSTVERVELGTQDGSKLKNGRMGVRSARLYGRHGVPWLQA